MNVTQVTSAGTASTSVTATETAAVSAGNNSESIRSNGSGNATTTLHADIGKRPFPDEN